MSRVVTTEDIPASIKTTEHRTRRLVITAILDAETGEATYQVIGEREVVTRIGGEIRAISNGWSVTIPHAEVIAHPDFAKALAILPAAIDDKEAAIEKANADSIAAEAEAAAAEKI